MGRKPILSNSECINAMKNLSIGTGLALNTTNGRKMLVEKKDLRNNSVSKKMADRYISTFMMCSDKDCTEYCTAKGPHSYTVFEKILRICVS